MVPRFSAPYRETKFFCATFRVPVLFPQSTFSQPPIRAFHRPILLSTIATPHSRNPSCTAVFRAVPRTQVFSRSVRGPVLSQQSPLCLFCHCVVMCAVVICHSSHPTSPRRYVTTSLPIPCP